MGGVTRRVRSVAALASAGLIAAGLAVATDGGVASAARSTASPSTQWLGYLGGPLHTSYSPAETLITPANAAGLTPQWSRAVGAPYTASPTVTGSAVYIGGANGVFYKFSQQSGKVLSRIRLGGQPALTCPAVGITSTATVGYDPRGHVQTVYVAGGDGYLYALRASNLSVEWRSVIGIPSTKVNNFYDWSSPTVIDGKIYIGISSGCDKPLVRGGLIEFSQATGAKLAEHFTVPAGARNAGGSIWSSIGVAPNGDVYATTGNGPKSKPQLESSEAILKFSPSLKLLGSFHVPPSQVTDDGDFGASPVFFGTDVGACDKNGIFYAVHQSTMKLDWSARIANSDGANGECIAAPADNGTDLFLAGGATTVDGTAYPGSVQERAPGNGGLVWSTGLPNGVLGSPTLDGAGLLTVGTYAKDGGVYLINAATGAIVVKLTSGVTFAQSVFANSRLYTATSDAVTAWALPAAG
jgi:outer membrane protein assembly factor BamB